MIYGLHGTSLPAARSLLASGWDPDLAAALATPGMRVGPAYLFAVWGAPGQPADQVVADHLTIAQGWAEEACERHLWGRRPYEAAVVLVRVPRLITVWAEEVALGREAEFIGIVARAIERDHEHPAPWHPTEYPGCPCCWQPEFIWEIQTWSTD